METILGFVAGYMAGSRDGQEGAKRLRDSFDAIRNSPEVRRMAGEAMMFAGVAVRRVMADRDLGGTVSTVTDMLAHRSAGDRAA